MQGADQMQPQSPELPGMGGAVPVLGTSGQVVAAGGLPGAAALHRVESTTRTSSAHTLVSRARTQISQHIVAESLRSRSLHPGWPGRYGNMPRQLACKRTASRGASLTQPSRGLQHRQRQHLGVDARGQVSSRSSVFTYSAVARVSGSASTRASRFDVGSATSILGTFRQGRSVIRWDHTLWNRSSRGQAQGWPAGVVPRLLPPFQRPVFGRVRRHCDRWRVAGDVPGAGRAGPGQATSVRRYLVWLSLTRSYKPCGKNCRAPRVYAYECPAGSQNSGSRWRTLAWSPKVE